MRKRPSISIRIRYEKQWNVAIYLWRMEIETSETLKLYGEWNIISGICKILSKISFFLVEHSLFQSAVWECAFFCQRLHLFICERWIKKIVYMLEIAWVRVSYSNFQSLLKIICMNFFSHSFILSRWKTKKNIFHEKISIRRLCKPKLHRLSENGPERDRKKNKCEKKTVAI